MTAGSASPPPLSLYQLLDPEVLANPYPLFRRLRTEDPVHWDPFLHAWVVTRYADVQRVLHDFSADRTPTPERLAAMGLESLAPIARVMVRQMLFMDPHFVSALCQVFADQVQDGFLIVNDQHAPARALARIGYQCHRRIGGHDRVTGHFRHR